MSLFDDLLDPPEFLMFRKPQKPTTYWEFALTHRGRQILLDMLNRKNVSSNARRELFAAVDRAKEVPYVPWEDYEKAAERRGSTLAELIWDRRP